MTREDPSVGADCFRPPDDDAPPPARPVSRELDFYLGLVGVVVNLALIFMAVRWASGQGTAIIVVGGLVVAVQVVAGLWLLLKPLGRAVAYGVAWLACSLLAVLAAFLL